MKVAVWDTYVTKKDGNVMHFDIIAPQMVKATGTIFKYGKAYLASKNEAEGKLDIEACQFCHIEEPSSEMLLAIQKQGFFILEMDDIPAKLPTNPTRRDLVLHLRAHFAEHRFADFRGKTEADLKALLR